MTFQQEKRFAKNALTFKTQVIKALDAVIYSRKIPRGYETESLADMADYIKICDVILKRDYKKAVEMMRSMDTYPREGLPSGIWKLTGYELV